jgi:serine/threonine-protein kinase
VRRDELIGRTIAKRFRVKRVLGEGGMATVFVAEQDAEPHEIALKILRSELHADKTFAKRFEREAKAAARVQHPNSVTIFDAGVEGDVSYIAMELLHGDDLYALLERHGTLSPRAAATIVAEVCDALAVAHGLGIVHRDLKPENIMIVRDPSSTGTDGPVSVPLPIGARVKVLDFGIAKLLDKQSEGPAPRQGSRLESPTGYTAVTRVGTLIGTPAYMSPEQCALQPVDTRSDIYTCGLLLFQMVSGRLPFDGPTPLHIATKHLHEEPPPLRSFVPGADATLEAIIDKTLAKRPADRHATARALAAALRKLIPELPDRPYGASDHEVDPEATPILAEDSITSLHGDVLPSQNADAPSERIASAKTMVADGIAAPPPSVVVRDGDLPRRPLAILARHAGPAAGRTPVVPSPPGVDDGAASPPRAPPPDNDARSAASTPVPPAPVAAQPAATARKSASTAPPRDPGAGAPAAPRPLAVLARHAPAAPRESPPPDPPRRAGVPAPRIGRADTDPAPATPTVQLTPDVEVESEPEDLASTLIRATPGEPSPDARDSFAPVMAGHRQTTMQSAAPLPTPDRPSRAPIAEAAPAPVAAKPVAGVQTLVSGQAAAAASAMISPAQAPGRAPHEAGAPIPPANASGMPAGAPYASPHGPEGVPLPSHPVPSVILSPSVSSPRVVPLGPPPAAPQGAAPMSDGRLHGSQGPTFGIPMAPAAPAAPIAAAPPQTMPGTLPGPMVSKALLLGVLIGVLGSAILFALAYVVFLTK